MSKESMDRIDKLIIGFILFIMALHVLVLYNRVETLKNQVVTLQAYNEEVWRTFHKMREIKELNGVER